MGEALSVEPRSPARLVGVSRRLWFGNLADLAKLYAVFLLPFAGVGLLLQFAMSEAIVEVNGQPQVVFATESDLLRFGLYSLIITFASAAAGVVASGAAVFLLSERFLGRTITWSEALRAAWSRIGALLLAALLAIIGIAIGMILLIIPGIYLAIAWWVSPAAVMIEGKRGWNALGRSRQLVSGRWWATFGTGFLAGLLFLLISVVISIGIGILSALGSPAFEVALASLLGSVSNIFVAPFLAAVVVAVYYDLLTREAMQPSGLAEGSPQPELPEPSVEHDLPDLEQEPPTL